MIDMPPECPPGFTVHDVFSVQAQHALQGNLGGYPCFIQLPDNLKPEETDGYPYFDFKSARKQNVADSESLQPAEISSSEFYLVILLGAITFIAFVTGFATGFIYPE
ncbi:TPA: hypothetical protein ACGT6A_005169 [Salmonella enterica]|nr:hypothetical protein [Salmonella enterica subsp. enterica serovar Newport]